MFNDDYGLTQAVLDGRKTMTRRIIKCPRTFRGEWVAGFNVHIRQSDKKIVDYPCMYDADEREFDSGEIIPRYKLIGFYDELTPLQIEKVINDYKLKYN